MHYTIVFPETQHRYGKDGINNGATFKVLTKSILLTNQQVGDIV
jgi:hypothetical protein